MSVRGKFYVSSITQFPDSVQVNMNAVCRGAQNKAWASATPAGSVSMTIKNDVAAGQFTVGKEYYLDFTLAEPAPQAGDGHPVEEYESYPNTFVCAVCGLYSGKTEDGKPDWSQHDEIYGSSTAPA